MGDTACDILIAGGGLLLLLFPVLWIIHWWRGKPEKEDIYIEED
jgi:hypothetical protein